MVIDALAKQTGPMLQRSLGTVLISAPREHRRYQNLGQGCVLILPIDGSC